MKRFANKEKTGGLLPQGEPDIITGIKLYGHPAYEGAVAAAREAIRVFAEGLQQLPPPDAQAEKQRFIRAHLPAISAKSSLTGMDNHLIGFLDLMRPLDIESDDTLVSEAMAESARASQQLSPAELLTQAYDVFGDPYFAFLAYAATNDTFAGKHALLKQTEDCFGAELAGEAACIVLEQMLPLARDIGEVQTFLQLYMEMGGHEDGWHLPVEGLLERLVAHQRANPVTVADAAATLALLNRLSPPDHEELAEQLMSGLITNAPQGDIPAVLDLHRQYGVNDGQAYLPQLGQKTEQALQDIAGRAAAGLSEEDALTFFALARLHRPENYASLLKTILSAPLEGQPLRDRMLAAANPALAACAQDVFRFIAGVEESALSPLINDTARQPGPDAELAYEGLRLAMGPRLVPQAYGDVLDMLAECGIPALARHMRHPDAFPANAASISALLQMPEERRAYGEFLMRSSCANVITATADAAHFHSVAEDSRPYVSPLYTALLSGSLAAQGTSLLDATAQGGSPLATARHTVSLLDDMVRRVVLPSLLNETPAPYQTRLASAVSYRNIDYVVDSLIAPFAEFLITGKAVSGYQVMPEKSLAQLLSHTQDYLGDRDFLYHEMELEFTQQTDRPSLLLNKHGATEQHDITLESGWKIQALTSLERIAAHEDAVHHMLDKKGYLEQTDAPSPYFALLSPEGRHAATLELAIEPSGHELRPDITASDARILVYEDGEQSLVEKRFAPIRQDATLEHGAHETRNQLYRMIRSGELVVNTTPRQNPRLKGENPFFAEAGIRNGSGQEWQMNLNVWDHYIFDGPEQAQFGLLASLPDPIQRSGIMPVEILLRQSGLYHIAMNAAQETAPLLPFRSTRPEWLEKVASEVYRPRRWMAPNTEERDEILATTSALHTLGVDTLSGVTELLGHEVDVTEFLNSRAGKDPVIREAMRGSWLQRLTEEQAPSRQR